MPNRPNLLYIITDQQAASAMSCAGNQTLHTPAIDWLAADGVRFDRAYCTQPLCIPSRASLVTGRYPHEVGVPYNMYPDACREVTRHPWVGGLLAEAGYDTAWVGKWHLPIEPEASDVHGFATTRAIGKKIDHLVAPECEKLWHTPRDRPLFTVASFVNPHDCCEAARGTPLPNGLIGDPPPPEQCPRLPANFEPPAGEPVVLREKVQPFTPKAYPSVDWDEGRWRQYLWQYGRLVEKVDRQIGAVLDALDATGQAENTVVLFTSDHGDGMAGHRWNQKQVLYEEAVRIPLLIRTPSGRRAAVDSHLVSMNLDLIPTLCDYAGRDVPESLPGRSLRPLAEGRTVHGWREAVYCETEFARFAPGVSSGVKGRVVRTERHKYIAYSEGADREQLFDMQVDPGEQIDLTRADGHRATLDRHRQLLADWCRRTGDTFPVPGQPANHC